MVWEYNGVEEAAPSRKNLIDIEISEGWQAHRFWELLYTGNIWKAICNVGINIMA